MNVTLDGFMSGPGCELDWHFKYWTTEMAEFMEQQLACADTILLGRITYEAMASYWGPKAMDLSTPLEDRAFAHMMNSHCKVVFSETLGHLPWKNSKRIWGNLYPEIIKLKGLPGKDIMLYGSGKLADALIKQQLVDEFHLWVHPVVLGEGKALFKNGMYHALKLFETKTFRSGVVALFYKQ